MAEAQRAEIDQAKRKVLVHQAQDLIMADVPYLFLVYPKNVVAYSSNVWKKDTIVDQSGIGVRNFWTFIGATPMGSQKDMVLNAAEALNAVNPLYISGAVDSWVTDLVWDRLMRVGPDGLPRPWSAESVTYVDPTTVEAKLRPGQTWHDGKPVTVEDVIYSFEAPAGDKSPMYKPFVANIASMEKVDDRTIRFKLKAPNASFFTSTLAKINLIPKHVWEPILSGNQLQGKNAESLPGAAAGRLRPVQGGALQAAGGDPAREESEPLGGAEDGSLDPAHRHQHRGGGRHAAARRGQLPRPTIAATRRSSTTSPSSRRSIEIAVDRRHGLPLRGAEPAPAAVRRREFPQGAESHHQPQPDGAGGVERLRGAGELARLGRAAVLVQGRACTGRISRRRRSCSRRPATSWSAASCTIPTARRKSCRR